VPSADLPGLTPEAELPAFTPLGEETVHQGWLLRIQRATFAGPDGQRFERDIVRHPGAVAVVAVTDGGGVLLVRQYRPAVDAWLLEIPAGTCDVAGEAWETTARRELAEEAGCAADRLVPLIRMANTPGFCDEWTSIFLATGLTPVAHDRHGAEEQHLEVVEVPLDAFDALVDDGTIVDAQTVLGVALARRHLTQGA
jgi:ADP-ribose pyrophosphatase